MPQELTEVEALREDKLNELFDAYVREELRCAWIDHLLEKLEREEI